MKQTIKILKLGLAAVLLTIASSATLLAAQTTGIRVQAQLYISEGTPEEIASGVFVGVGDLQMPVAASFTITTAPSGRQPARVVGHFTANAEGDFTVRLPVGKYIVVPDTLTNPFDSAATMGSFTVTVRPRDLSLAQIWYFQEGFPSLIAND
jgi:hypothetical protein